MRMGMAAVRPGSGAERPYLRPTREIKARIQLATPPHQRFAVNAAPITPAARIWKMMLPETGSTYA
jgi:hypothetical protein